VMAYVVALRTRELGLRIALGATPSAVVGMLTRQGIGLTGAGIVGGLLLFALVARFLRTLLFGVAPTDLVTLGGASLLLVGIAALASWLPARRTSRLDPADVLRAE
jgi:putative ABC transport system permease protein